MNKTAIPWYVSGDQVEQLLAASRMNGADFDLYAALMLISELGQSVEDAIKFGEIFVLTAGYQEQSMDELVLTNALSKGRVTVDDLVELDTTLDSFEYESERVAVRNQYLAARSRGVSHADAMAGKFYSSIQ